MKMNYTFILVCVFSSLFSFTFAEKKPNILILLADDLGYGELGCYGQEVIQTPTIDALAEKGLRFTQFYAGTSVCAPSRAVLMTGIHAGKVSIRGNRGYFEEKGDWDRIALRKDEVTIAEMLKSAGYQTAFVGKWHLGDPLDVSTWAHGRGFDYAVQEQWGSKAEGGKFDVREHQVNGRESTLWYDYSQYDCLDEFRTNIALDYFDKQYDASKPFFLFMSFRSPHAHEFYLGEMDRYKEHRWPEIERRHASRISMLDQQVKRLLDKLEKIGELNNTFILFTSDNGPHGEEKHDPYFFESSNGLKGHKRDMYEGGVRVPGIAYWAGKSVRGVSEHQAIFYDIMPTLAEVAGVEAPKQTDGISFLPEVLGKEQTKHDHLYWELQTLIPDENGNLSYRRAARTGDWKAVRYEDKGSTELYNLTSDLYEKNDIAKQHPEIVKSMEKVILECSEKNPHFPNAGMAIE
jgi:arylsulfatase A-like enzyme